MPAPVRTKSELLFEELCTLHRIVWTRLPERDEPQPDYELVIDGCRIAAEVKQIEANESDRSFADELERNGHAFERRDPDAMAQRVRQDIADSRPQLRAYVERHPGAPGLLILFDDAKNGYDDINTIRTAMFGWEQVVLSNTDRGPVIVDRGFGPRNNSEIRHNHNTQLSALVTLHEGTDYATRQRRLGLCFYHNHYAHAPFAPEWWTGEQISHLRLAEKSQGQFQDFVGCE